MISETIADYYFIFPFFPFFPSIQTGNSKCHLSLPLHSSRTNISIVNIIIRKKKLYLLECSRFKNVKMRCDGCKCMGTMERVHLQFNSQWAMEMNSVVNNFFAFDSINQSQLGCPIKEKHSRSRSMFIYMCMKLKQSNAVRTHLPLKCNLFFGLPSESNSIRRSVCIVQRFIGNSLENSIELLRFILD